MPFPMILSDDKSLYRHPHLAGLAHAVDGALARAPRGLKFVGIAPLFDEARLYQGADSDWLFGPAATDPHVSSGPFPVPDPQLRQLKAVLDSGVDFPAVYIAHELDRSRTAPVLATAAAAKPGTGLATPAALRLPADKAAALVGPPPAPPGATRRARQVGLIAERLGTAIGKALPVLAATAALPVLVAGAAFAGLAGGLDPMVLGALTVDGRADIGQPAAWFVLASWQW